MQPNNLKKQIAAIKANGVAPNIYPKVTRIHLGENGAEVKQEHSKMNSKEMAEHRKGIFGTSKGNAKEFMH